MRVDAGSMMQGQIQTDFSDISALLNSRKSGQESSDFAAFLGIVNSVENVNENGMEFISDVEKTDESADNILEASVVEIPSEEHEFSVDNEEEISPEIRKQDDRKTDFYQNVINSGLAADMQTVIVPDYTQPVIRSSDEIQGKTSDSVSSVSKTGRKFEDMAVRYVDTSEQQVVSEIKESPEFKESGEYVSESTNGSQLHDIHSEPEMTEPPESKKTQEFTETPEVRNTRGFMVKPDTAVKAETPESPVVKAEAETPERPVVKAEVETPERPVVEAKAETPERPVVKAEVETPERPVVKAEAETPGRPVVEAKVETPERPVVKAEAEATEKPVVNQVSQMKESDSSEAIFRPEMPEIGEKAVYENAAEYGSDNQIVSEIRKNTVNVSENDVIRVRTEETVSDGIKVQNSSGEKFSSGVQITEKSEISYHEIRNSEAESNFGHDSSSDDEASLSYENAEVKEIKLSENNTSDSKEENISEFEKLVQGAVTLTPFSFMRTDTIMSESYNERQISAQTFRALDESITRNRKNFVIRLNPEGLGEITVKLIKSDSSVLVRMIASDRKTAELLNRDLDVLQDQLKSHNAELETVEYRSPEDTLQNMMNGNEQFRRDQHDAGHRDGSGRNMTYFTQNESEEEESSVKIMPSVIGNTILNRFI